MPSLIEKIKKIIFGTKVYIIEINVGSEKSSEIVKMLSDLDKSLNFIILPSPQNSQAKLSIKRFRSW